MFKTTKAKVIAVVIFCMICISITVGLILYKNIEIDDDKEVEPKDEPTNIITKDVSGIDKKGTYNQNDLKLEEKRITREKAEITYFEIYGLKNKIIQDSINDEIRETALNYYKEDIKDLNEVINVSVRMNKMANYSNVLSIELYYVAKKDDNGDGLYDGFKGLNYDLTTGEKISFEKIFTSDAPMQDILRQSAYYSFVENGELEMNLAGDLIVNDYNDIEDKVIEFLDLYKNKKIKEFSFSPSKIYVYLKDSKILEIDMEKYADYIAIYNRYLTKESIFEESGIGLKNLFTLTDRYPEINTYTNYQKESNYFIDVSIQDYTENDEISKKIIQDKIEGIEAEINRAKTNAAKDPNSFYVVNYHISLFDRTDLIDGVKLISCSEAGNSYEMTVHDFEEIIEQEIRDYIKRESNSGAVPDYVYDFSKTLKIEPQTILEYYNTQTGEKVVI